MDPFSGFAEPTRAWFESAFGEPTEVQARAWPEIRAGHNVLAVAPTGSGKTLAAFLSALDRCLQPRADRGVRVLYISPLKALAIDVERNLRAPLVGIAARAEALGQPVRSVTVGVRTGDTTPRDRAAMVRHPPDILITTPESLFLLLTSQARSMLTDVETVIVDEVHAVAGTKRGAHLAVSLARLDHLVGRAVPRVGLSATVRPLDEAARFLSPTGPVHIVTAGTTKQWDLTIQVPVPDMTDLLPPADATGPATGSMWPHVEERIVDLVSAHRSTIVFANSRRLAERLTARLNEIHAERHSWPEPPAGSAPPAQVMAQSGASRGSPPVLARAHHGSVSKEQRAQIEDDLKSGRLPTVVATSSLELGIDMGAVDLVIQVEAPPSVASGLQRVGRAAHQVGAISQGVLLPKYRSDLLASATVVEQMRAGAIEAVRVPSNPLDVAAQQIVAIVAMEDWTSADLLALLRTTAPFQDLTPAVFESVVEMLAGRYPSDAFAELRPRLVWDRQTDTLHARPGAARLAVTSGGTIPDRGLFGVFLVGGGRVGELDEEMVYESRVGDVFSLGASSWQVSEITHDRVLVTPAPGAPGRLPFWHGDALGRPAELGRAIGRFTREVAERPPERALQWLTELGLDPWAAGNLVAYVHEQSDSGSHLPSDRTLVVERSRDELGDWRIMVLSPFGAQVHAPWALVARERLVERFGVDASVLHGDDGIVARLPDMPGEAWLDEATACLFPDADTVLADVTRLIGASALFASRFRECASRALLLPRPRPGRRAPLWQQRQRSAQLLQIAAEHPTFPIVLETVRECLQDVYDLPALVDLLSQVRDRRIRVVECSPHAASPFAQSLLFGYIAQFMYEGDSPLAERRAAALTLDPSLLGELLGQTDLRELLDSQAIIEVEALVQHLSPDRHARDAEDAADLLRILGPLTTVDAADRGIDLRWLDELLGQRRVFQTRVAGQDMWAAVEDAARLRDGLGAVLPPGLAEAHLRPVADATADLVARYARTHGPFTTGQAADGLGLPVAVIDTLLSRMHTRGQVVRGALRPDAPGSQWCHADVLRLIKRRSVALLRHQIEPVDQRTLAAFLPGWQHIEAGDRPGRLRGADGVLEALRSFAGVPVPVSALETAILPARVADYSPALLDELTTAGEVIWTGAAALPGGDGWICLAPSELWYLLPTSPAPVADPMAVLLLELLRQGGGWFAADLARRLASAHEGPAASGNSDGSADVTESVMAAALSQLLWAGLVSNDTIEPVRLARDRARAGGPRHRARSQARLGRPPRGRYADLWRGPTRTTSALRDDPGLVAAQPPTRGPGTADDRRVGSPSPAGRPQSPAVITGAGRWFALSEERPPTHVAALALAEAQLDRLGVVTRGSLGGANDTGGFAGAYRTLSAMEERGRVHRVYAVDGLGAAQFALPGVVDRLRQLQRDLSEHTGELLVLAATDPANAYGAALDWPASDWAGPGSSPHRPGRTAGSFVVLRGGAVVLYVERGGRSLLTFPPQDGLPQAAAALAEAVRAGRVPALTITRINGQPALAEEGAGSEVAAALRDSGFTLTPQGFRARR